MPLDESRFPAKRYSSQLREFGAYLHQFGKIRVSFVPQVLCRVKFPYRALNIALVLSGECRDKMPSRVLWIEKKHLFPNALNQGPVRTCTRLLGKVQHRE